MADNNDKEKKKEAPKENPQKKEVPRKELSTEYLKDSKKIDRENRLEE